MFTIRDLKTFLNKLPDEILDSPIFIEDDLCEQREVKDINHTFGQQSGHKLVLEFEGEYQE